jgi:hypothetical protein
MDIPPVPQFVAQHPSTPFCQMTCVPAVEPGLDGEVLPQDHTEAAPVARRAAAIVDIRTFISFPPGDKRLETLRFSSSTSNILSTSEPLLMQRTAGED